MSDADRHENRTIYVLVQYGTICSYHYSAQDALLDAKERVDEMISDHWRHKLPVQVTEEVARGLDIRIYRLDSQAQLALPIQQWFDQHHAMRQASSKESEELEYRRYLELREKWEDRFLKERESNCGLLNCS